LIYIAHTAKTFTALVIVETKHDCWAVRNCQHHASNLVW